MLFTTSNSTSESVMPREIYRKVNIRTESLIKLPVLTLVIKKSTCIF